jgi:hypothetical protein
LWYEKYHCIKKDNDGGSMNWNTIIFAVVIVLAIVSGLVLTKLWLKANRDDVSASGKRAVLTKHQIKGIKRLAGSGKMVFIIPKGIGKTSVKGT